ncbi:hypothetical protein [Roseateles chitinivorans]|uniref:hypothetical protein n=1 Tax=Roseateles chitinivorans TaxID=2917965 RepID=UPI003D67F9B1
MTNLRATNYLLLAIVLCLVLLLLKDKPTGLIPEARAANATSAEMIYGCFKRSEYQDCIATAVRVDESGRLLLVKGP